MPTDGRNRQYHKVLLTLTALICAVSMLAGCGKMKVSYPEGTETYEYTDDYGRIVELKKDITRIVPSGPNTQMILVTLAPEMLVGVSEAPSSAVRKYYPENYIDLPTLGQFYGKKMSINLENLIGTDAEIIIDAGDEQADGYADMDKIQNESGIAAIYVEATLENYPTAYRKLGKILGKEKEADELAAYCEETSRRAEKIKESLSEDERKSVYFGVNSTGLNSNAGGSVQAAVIEFIGARNAIEIDDGDVSGRDGGNPVGMEVVYKSDPDIVIVADGGPYDEMSDQGSQWSELDAVREGRYYEIPTKPVSWMSAPPCVNQVLGARWLMSLVYPDLYEGDIREDVKEYYRLFWHYDLTDKEIDEFLANSTEKAGRK